MVLEIHGGLKFVKGSCGGIRTNANNAVIDTSMVSPNNGEAMNITIIAAWAKSYSGGVKLAAPITFQIQKNPPTSSVQSDL
jgi:hypothetical protein